MLHLLKADLLKVCLAVSSVFTPLSLSHPVEALPKPLPIQQSMAVAVPAVSVVHAPSGLASWYGTEWNGRPTASGEIFDETRLTASHKTLPFGTMVRVINVSSGKSVIVRINDRGTLRPDRVIDLTSRAAHDLGIFEQGVARVRLEVLGGRASLRSIR